MILSASGGLVYHTRALFTELRGQGWELTRRAVASALTSWLERTRPSTLVVFGPSAGYLLPRDFFARFGLRLIVIEPDPIARALFRCRFKSSPKKFQRDHRLLPFMSRDPNDFRDFLLKTKLDAANESLAVLFFGVLGQIDLHKNMFTRSKTEGCQILSDSLRELEISWASLHDLESAELGMSLSHLSSRLVSACAEMPSKNRIEKTHAVLESESHAPRSWTDHETAWIGLPLTVIPWLLSPRCLHIMGWTESP